MSPRTIPALLALLAAVPAHPVTRRVPQDLPTIAQALALSNPHDSVRVAPGVYAESGLVMRDRVVLCRQESPGVVVLQGDGAQRILGATSLSAGTVISGLQFRGGHADRGGALLVTGGSLRVESCVFAGNQATLAGGALAIEGTGAPQLVSCTFWGNQAPLGSALHASLQCQAQVEACLFTANTGAPPLELPTDARLTQVRCTDISGNEAGDWTGFVSIYEGVLGNFSAPPRLCDPPAGDFGLAEDSPCLPSAGPCGALVGALGASCAVGELVVDMGFTPAQGPVPLAVQFSDQTLGGPEAWWWDFEDDGFWDSTEQNPAHVYLRAGVFRPRLAVQRGGMLREAVAATPLRPLFQSAITAAPMGGRMPLSVNFTAQAIGQPASWLWRFGDGDSLLTDGPAATHVYPVGGQFNPVLVTRDAFNEHVAGLAAPLVVVADTLRVQAATPNLATVWPLVGEGTVILLEEATYYSSGLTLPDGAQLIGLPDAGGVLPRIWPQGTPTWLFRHATGAGEVLVRDVHFQLHDWCDGLSQWTGTLRVERCEFLGPVTVTYAISTSGVGSLMLRDCVFQSCVLDLRALDSIRVEGCHFLEAPDHALSLDGEARATLQDCRFTDGQGGVDATTRTLELRGCDWRRERRPLLVDVDSLWLENCRVVNCQGAGNPLLDLRAAAPFVLRDLIASHNSASPGGAAVLRLRSPWSLEECLLAANQDLLLLIADQAAAEVSCTLVQGNELGDWVGRLAPWQGLQGNLEQDPLVCDWGADTLSLGALSPCLPQHNSCGVAIGGLEQGCFTTGVTADFWAEPLSGAAPLAVAFHDQSSGQVGGRSWDFQGDGLWESSERDPVHVYELPGDYDVVLSVYNMDYSSTLTRPGYVHVTAPRTLRVPEDYASVALAVAEAQAGDTLDLACGTWPAQDLALPDDLTLRSRTGRPDCASLDAQGLGRCLGGDSLRRGIRVEGLTLTGGAALAGGAGGLGGAFYFTASNALFRHCVLRGNQARHGAAGAAGVDSLLRLEHCVLHGNTATQGTAALLLSGGEGRLAQCLVTDNSGPGLFGGALHFECTSQHDNSAGDWTGSYADQLGQEGNLAADPLYCDAGAGDFRLQADSPCLPPASPCGAMGAFAEACLSLVVDAPAARAASLDVSGPNPFNPATTLDFRLARPTTLTLRVVNLAGREVALLARGPHAAGPHAARFDGERLASGLYVALLETPEGTEARKLLLVK